MIRTLLSLGSIAVAVGLLISGTVAFFSDTESSVGNVFAAGAFDLKIDNESYYNGNVCADVSTNPEVEEWQWVGEADYPVPGTPCSTSFTPSDLDEGLLFFNFTDVKPDDEGEDTISIHVENDAWVCLDLELTANDDESSTEPELKVDEPENGEDLFDGELAEGIEFFWWADDGDNVYEEGENGITDGVVSLATLDATFPVALADSATNVWGEPVGTPIPGEETVYIAKAWCLGDLTLDPVAAGQGENPSVASGVICDGSDLGNEFQTDSASMNISFSAVQARNNGQYLCREPEQPTTGSLTVTKEVEGGNAAPSEFTFTVSGPSGVFPGVKSGDTLNNLEPGNYTVEETGGPTGYTASFAQCGDGTVAVTGGNNTDCTVTNIADPGSFTLDKSVSYSVDGILISISDFHYFIDNGDGPIQVFDQVARNDLEPGTYTIYESYEGDEEISYEALFSGDCVEIDDTETATIEILPGGSVSCDLENEITAFVPAD